LVIQSLSSHVESSWILEKGRDRDWQLLSQLHYSVRNVWSESANSNVTIVHRVETFFSCVIGGDGGKPWISLLHIKTGCVGAYSDPVTSKGC